VYTRVPWEILSPAPDRPDRAAARTLIILIYLINLIYLRLRARLIYLIEPQAQRAARGVEVSAWPLRGLGR